MLATIYTAILGLITGLIYSFALGFAWDDGLLYGFGIGVMIGVLLAIIQRFMAARNQVNKRDTQLLSGYLLVLLMVTSVASGLIVWMFRVAIF